MSEPGVSVPQTKYDGIIPTGWLTAYGRTFSDIPYAVVMFDELEAVRVTSGSTGVLEEMKDVQLAPQFEARHKLLGRLIREAGAEQVLEVAAGLSTRGLELTEDPSSLYVEVDLPGMMADKRKIVDHMVEKGAAPRRTNLHFVDGSAVDLADLEKASELFDPSKPLTIVNEGLLRYLSFDEKAKYAANVAALLKKFGGAWITSDISLPQIFYKEDDVMKLRRARISQITGVNVANNLFKGEADAKKYFEDLGFDVESHSFQEIVGELTSPAKLAMPQDFVEAIISSAVVFVMRLKASSR